MVQLTKMTATKGVDTGFKCHLRFTFSGWYKDHELLFNNFLLKIQNTENDVYCWGPKRELGRQCHLKSGVTSLLFWGQWFEQCYEGVKNKRKNSPTMDFHNRTLFPLKSPEVSEAELSKWRRAFTVFIWLLGFNFLFLLKTKTLRNSNCKPPCF